VDSDGDIVWSETSSGSNCYSLAGAAISGGWVFYGNDDGYLHGRANYTLSDFNVGVGVDKWAYKFQVIANPPDTNIEPDEEFTSEEYTNIAADDSIYASHQTTDDENYSAHRFVFKIDDNEKPWITYINVTWNGKAWYDDETGGQGAKLYIWNGTGMKNWLITVLLQMLL
jgi:hypothetical protein